MPYRTPFGKHYHEKLGCRGAFISCKTDGLEPCNICCTNASYKTQSSDSKWPVAGDGSSQPKSEPLASAPQRDIKEGELSDLAIRYAEVRKRFKGNDRSKQEDTEGSTPESSNQSEVIDPKELIARFEEAHSHEDLRNDHDGAIRYQLVQQIEERAQTFEFRYQTARYRSEAQREWNDRHPDTKILEWSHKDPDYSGNGPRGVVYKHRDREWSLDYRASCTVMDKATCEDVTEKIFACYAEIEWRQEQIRNFDVSVVSRIYTESGGDRVFDAWLERKYRSTHNRRYRPKSPGQYRGLYTEFSEDTHHFEKMHDDLDSGAIQYTDAEQKEHSRLTSQYEQSIERLKHMMSEYGIGNWGVREGDWRTADSLLIIESNFPDWRQYVKEHPVIE